MRKANPNAVLVTIVGIVCATLLSGIGWIIVKMFDMTTTVNVTAQRVERIVSALPDLRVKIAMEDLERKIGLAVVSRPPIQLSQGRCVRPVFFFDYHHGKIRRFDIPARSIDDLSGLYTVAGFINRIAIEKLTFDELAAASTEVGRPKPYPDWIDPEGSSVILRLRTDYARKIEAQFGKPLKELDIVKKELNWQQFIDDLIQNRTRLDPEPSPQL